MTPAAPFSPRLAIQYVPMGPMSMPSYVHPNTSP